ncbi:MAG: hypothetical protein EBZ05_09410 [Verrucomicrobia bacterium]|nr:hypothetical protein [Verrucomicrobiota bacterium]
MFPHAVLSKVGIYVYLYRDPRDGKIFYVGKGKGQRAFQHLSDEKDGPKNRKIQEIREAGLEPKIEILTHGLKDDETALKIEAALIDLIGIDELVNEVRGYEAISHGKMDVQELVALYDAPKGMIRDQGILLIRINQLFRHGMGPEELYEATRGVWKIGARRDSVRHVLALYQGVVKEVYAVEGWEPANWRVYRFRADELKAREKQDVGRWQFGGSVAKEPIRGRYLGKDVSKYLVKGAMNPIQYVKP